MARIRKKAQATRGKGGHEDAAQVGAFGNCRAH